MCSHYLNFNLGTVETFAVLSKQTIIVLFLLLVGIPTRKITSFNRTEFPLIAMMALSGIFLGQYLFLKCQQYSDPFYTALWQPLVPVFATGTSIVLGFESVSAMKIGGFLTCAVVVIWNIVDDMVRVKVHIISTKHVFLIL